MGKKPDLSARSRSKTHTDASVLHTIVALLRWATFSDSSIIDPVSIRKNEVLLIGCCCRSNPVTQCSYKRFFTPYLPTLSISQLSHHVTSVTQLPRNQKDDCQLPEGASALHHVHHGLPTYRSCDDRGGRCDWLPVITIGTTSCLHIALIQNNQTIKNSYSWGCYCEQFLQASNRQASVFYAFPCLVSGDSHKHGSNICPQARYIYAKSTGKL